MKESLSQTLTLRQQQTLSPLQVRFVRMLEMNGPEIEEEVRRELDDNPALEVADVGDMSDDESVFNESAEEMQLADYKDDDMPSYRLEARNHGVDDRYYEPTAVSSGHNIYETLMEQLGHTGLSPQEIEVARYLIGNIDDNGYMTRPLVSIGDDVAVKLGIDLSDDQLRAISDVVRSLDPPGVGAVDLRDCLLLQVRRLPQTDDVKLARDILSHYFDLFSLKHYERLRSALGVDSYALKRATDVIRSLNPKPGSALDDNDADTAMRVYPDFNVDVDGDKLTLTLLNNLPELQIEETFTKDVNGGDVPSSRRREAEAFIKTRRDDAESFIKMLKMRQTTLYRIMSAIVGLQQEFFYTGDESRLRPMILKDVAAVSGDDISVISRVTSGKYVSTPWGVYPLKHFFNERHGEDDDTSTHEIIAVLREIIDGEDRKSPLSDEALTARLKKRGYAIARRTVAKYRERLGIPVARLRREL